jgi:hypothetical protein
MTEQTEDSKSTRSISRRSLVAAGSIVMVALGTRIASAQQYIPPTGGGGTTPGGTGQCFLRGTSIRTPSGDREVSALSIGDLVLTHSGEAKPIKWIGRRQLRREGTNPWREDVVPIKVARSALGDGVPHTDLYLSPGHALYIDGTLITVGSLVNGRTIVRCCGDDVDVLEYFHVELSDHDVIFADGAPAESFPASLDHRLFDNWREYEALYGLAPISAMALPITAVTGGRLHLRSRLRSALSPLVDKRTPFDKARDRIEERAERMRSAA